MSNRLAVEQPTRGADRNRSLADQADPATDDMLLPSLKDGVTLLDVEGGRGVPILQSLVLDHLLLHAGPAFWVDANGHATTTTLSQIAPSRRLLDRIHVARGFTAYQHYGAVSDLPTAVNQSIQESTSDDSLRNRQPTENDDESPHTPSLIVAPAVDIQYRADDTLGETHAETLQTRTLARLATYADGYDIPVLVTRTKRNDFTASGVTAADHHLECEQTRMGPRVVGDGFETLVYPSTTVRTTRRRSRTGGSCCSRAPRRSAWNRRRRRRRRRLRKASGRVSQLTVRRSQPPRIPLFDAWTATGTGGR